MATQLLMPKATAVWLVDNTALSFEQIADFCKLHVLEVKAIADGDSSCSIKGLNPISSGQLTRSEITRVEADPTARLKLAESKVNIPLPKRKGARYIPLSRRQDRPNGILWLVLNHPELKDAQIARLIGTTKSTIEQIRNRTHWNSSNLTPMDPVGLGLCSQIDFEIELRRAAKNRPQSEQRDETLLPASVTENALFDLMRKKGEDKSIKNQEFDADKVFAKLNTQVRDAQDAE
ncbi:hypothetical protein X471_00802 [Bartonella bacilliformis str. Heidi Mejia]|uniref:Cytoplasmic protein n=2 Tax=Bartonella bacilliformis TaxID=774 RepID=A1UR99_BARBK|nr:cell cycle transcriptional regulator TrcR [Bartonella bacilliformis]ABM45058.1 conserved hypothetical protein [Bartonella bacilliformis KC583]AMG85382.1 DUF1013 domain-containing protein [Bartonella bacilliformis]EKS46053.1 putative cytoplasmic protein [Bartonella bacilliformis INS]EYS89098.1 hypothetical protein X472_00798 [Bartonella bacilliformis San Pedro600-02]EYS91204.1 hypothetical protein X471_00802 [Bartonella bacilliformis str. Heidi Mejia]